MNTAAEKASLKTSFAIARDNLAFFERAFAAPDFFNDANLRVRDLNNPEQARQAKEQNNQPTVLPMVYQDGVVRLTSSSKTRGFIAMFLCRSLSFHPSFSFYTLRQNLTDTVDHYGGARIAYRARRAAFVTPGKR